MKPGAKEILTEIFLKAKQDAGAQNYLSDRAHKYIRRLTFALVAVIVLGVIAFIGRGNKLESDMEYFKTFWEKKQLDPYGVNTPEPKPGDQVIPPQDQWNK